MNPTRTILIIDDDPTHLQIYRMVVETAGFRGLPILVSSVGLNLPEGETIDAVLLDYRLAPNISAANVARQVRARFPTVPILILSDLLDAPADTAPYVQGFVRKGDPEKLLVRLRELVGQSV
jgi:DNA-binding response OmpR family regulator